MEETCPNNAIVSRLGGDEFVIMLRHVNRHDAQVMIEKLDTALQEAFTIEQVPGDISIGGSFGLAPSFASTICKDIVVAAAFEVAVAVVPDDSSTVSCLFLLLKIINII